MRALLTVLLVGASWAAWAAEKAGTPLEVPHLRQEKDGCGAASVAMVMQYWERSFPAVVPASKPPGEVYRELFDAKLGGVRLRDMKSYLESAGFQVFTFRGELADLDHHLARGRPVIVALAGKPAGDMHFAVIAGLDGRHAWLNDASKKNPSRIRRDRFDREWANADRWLLLATPRQRNP
jgi:ABC-type bacteriocin/lantibiotic exporter with double-glycine peptidase domain